MEKIKEIIKDIEIGDTSYALAGLREIVKALNLCAELNKNDENIKRTREEFAEILNLLEEVFAQEKELERMVRKPYTIANLKKVEDLISKIVAGKEQVIKRLIWLTQ